jgi:predicted amidohydrolase YtcJ
VTRRTRSGKHPNGWVPEQKVSLEESLAAYTRGAAYAGFSDQATGALRPGAYADLVVLSRDLLSIPDTEIESVHVTETYVQGEEAYRRG